MAEWQTDGIDWRTEEYKNDRMAEWGNEQWVTDGGWQNGGWPLPNGIPHFGGMVLRLNGQDD